MAADIVAAYVGNNTIPASEIGGLLVNVHTALHDVANNTGEKAQEARPEPAVPVKKSVTDDYIICLEDGKRFKSLKRHLAAKYDMTPDDYRRRWNLPSDYPMVAPAYAKSRSELAKRIGLGRRPAGG